MDDVSIWIQIFNFVSLCPKRWFQFNSRIVRTHFSSRSKIIWSSFKIIWGTNNRGKAPPAIASEIRIPFRQLKIQVGIAGLKNPIGDPRSYLIEVKPVNQSLESLNSEVVYCSAVFWMFRSISVTRPISGVFWLEFDLEECKMIYSFVDISQHLSFIYTKSM